MYTMHMKATSDISFEWDPRKAETNRTKHGVSFEEAATVFGDSYARIIPDPDHSNDEERFVILGLSLQARALTVCHCHRSTGEVVRIISARKATKNEESTYWRFRHEG